MEYLGCLKCKHFDFQKYGTCKAFPYGIPLHIVSGDVEHTKPSKGQINDIVYEPIVSK